MGIVFGLLAALGWGAGDFVLSRINRSVGTTRTLLYVQTAGLIAISLVILVTRDLPPLDPGLWLLAVGVNIFNLAGTVLLYRALAVGTLAIVSPIAASFAVVTTLLALAAGERPTPLALGGVALVMGGVIVVSQTPGAGDAAGLAPTRGAPAAIGAALCYGVFFWLLRSVTSGMGIAWPILIGRVMAVGAAMAFLAVRREGRPGPMPRRLWGAVALATSLDTVGFLSYNLGISTAYVSVVTAMASIFSAVTVLLAWVLLRERLASRQWAGVVAVIAGVLLVSV
ncbi:MAG: DMT family transporter [Chloroflexales bacterium]|nr:DMT family transporter [Chloroflexales bacterium]